MAALNRAWSLRCQVRSAGAGSVVEGLALAVIAGGGASFPGGRYVAPIASATRRASPEFSEPGARRTPRNRHLRTLPGGRPLGCTRIPRCRMSYQVISLLTRHDDMSLCVVRFRERRGSQGCSCTPGWPGQAAGGHQPRLEETGFGTALAACVAALLLIVAAVAVALLVSGHGTAGGQGTAADAAPSDPAGTAGTPVAMPAAPPRPRATAVPSGSPATPGQAASSPAASSPAASSPAANPTASATKPAPSATSSPPRCPPGHARHHRC
jgi:hypothetical protein